MSWVPNKAPFRHLIAAVLLVSASAALADILVVRSIGPSAKSFPPGKRLAQGAKVVLKANDSIDVLDGRGTRTLRGPGTFVAGASTGSTASNTVPAGRRARIGAVRGVDTGPLRPPSIWHVDVSKSSTICVAQPTGVTLWRADSGPAMKLNITRVSDGTTRQVDWEAGASTLGWPTSLPIVDGADYRLSWAGAAAPTAIRFRTLPQRPVGLEDTAAFMLSNQCQAQLDLFIETVRIPDTTAPAG